MNYHCCYLFTKVFGLKKVHKNQNFNKNQFKWSTPAESAIDADLSRRMHNQSSHLTTPLLEVNS